MGENRLTELRKRDAISRAQLARDLDVDASTLWRWERGVIAIPDVHKRTLSQRFKCSVEHLLGWDRPESDAA